MAEHDIEKIVEAGGEVFNFRDPTKQPVADRVTSIRAASSATDTKYPTEKAVAKAVESVSTTDKLYANQLWGGEFRTSQSPGDTYFFMQRNCFFGVKPSAVRVEYSTDGGTTWLDYGLTDTQKVELFSQYGDAAVVCGHNTHIQPGYTGTVPAGSTKDLTNEIIADQRLRITICTNSLAMEGTSGTTDVWMYCTLKRIGIYMSTQSASKGPTHCVFQGRTGANFIAGNDTWKTFGDYKIMGDYGWNSIPCSNATSQNGIVFGNTSSQYRELRFEIWSDSLSDSPASSQTGNLRITRVVGFSELLWTNNSINPNMGGFGSPYSVNSSTGVANFSKGLTSGVAIPVGSGGTGKTSVTSGNYVVGAGTSALVEKTPKTVGNNVLAALDEGSSAFSTDNAVIITGDATAANTTKFYRRKFSYIWTWIQSKISTVLGLSTTGYTGTADTAKAFDTSFSGTNSIASALGLKPDGFSASVDYTNAVELSIPYSAGPGRVALMCVATTGNGDSVSFQATFVKNANEKLKFVVGTIMASTGTFVSPVLKFLSSDDSSPAQKVVLYINANVRCNLSCLVAANDGMSSITVTEVARSTADNYSSLQSWGRLANDSGVVHIDGTETIIGAKEFSRSGQDTNFTDSSGVESIVRARTSSNSNNGSAQIDAYAGVGKFGLYARNASGTGKWVACLDNDGVVNLGSSGDAVRIGGTKFVFGASQLGTDSNTFYWA